MKPIKIKDENGKETEVDAESVVGLSANKSESNIKTLVIFVEPSNTLCFMFSCEKYTDIWKRVQKAINKLKEEDDDCIGLTD